LNFKTETMNIKQTFTLLPLLLLAAYSFAQTGVSVTYYDGNVQNYNVSAAGKLYFDANNLFVKTDASATAPTTIPVTLIRKITFTTALGTQTFAENANNLALYPNPGGDFVKIKSETFEALSTKFYSLTGQLVKQGVYQTDENIDISGLTAGLYFVQVNGSTLKFSKK